MYFNTKNYLKNNHYHTAKHILSINFLTLLPLHYNHEEYLDKKNTLNLYLFFYCAQIKVRFSSRLLISRGREAVKNIINL